MPWKSPCLLGYLPCFFSGKITTMAGTKAPWLTQPLTKSLSILAGCMKVKYFGDHFIFWKLLWKYVLFARLMSCPHVQFSDTLLLQKLYGIMAMALKASQCWRLKLCLTHFSLFQPLNIEDRWYFKFALFSHWKAGSNFLKFFSATAVTILCT